MGEDPSTPKKDLDEFDVFKKNNLEYYTDEFHENGFL